LPTNIFVQFLAGPREVRGGVTGLLLWLIALFSLVAGPIALLVFFQLQFLPYHNEWVTWWQRMAVGLDLALLLTLWPAVMGVRTETSPRGEGRRRKHLLGAIAPILLISFVSIPLVFGIATFPGEWLEKQFESVDDLFPREAPLTKYLLPPLTKYLFLPLIKLRTALVAGAVDIAARRPESLWSNRLVLPDSM